MTGQAWMTRLKRFARPHLINDGAKTINLICVAIAANTGWSESEILNMDVQKALDYLEAIKTFNKTDDD